MNRIIALRKVKEELERLAGYLQQTDNSHPMQKADPYWDTKCFSALVEATEEAVEWIEDELLEEMDYAESQEEQALPSNGIRTGALVGE